MNSTPHLSIEATADRITPLIRSHALTSFRSMVAGSIAQSGDGFLRIVTGAPHPFGNFACMTDGLDQARVMSVIEPLVACGAPSAVICCGVGGQHADAELVANGFAKSSGLIAQAVDIAKLASTTLASGYRFARASSLSERGAWSDALARAYGLPVGAAAPFATALGEQTAHDASLQYFWILKGEEPVCTSVLCMPDGVAGIYAVATTSAERGKGLGACATAEPLRIAHALGYRVGVLQATQEGHPVYRRLGFGDFGELPLYLRA